nr:MAG: RNA-dependent RNA polymerase [Crogonang virus 124]
MRMSWQIVMKIHGKSGMDQFRKHVSMISYGDDNALNISREVIGVYNQQTIADALAIIAHTYTDEGKTGEIVKSRSLSDINFLKRGFVFSQELQRYIAPLEEQVIYEMINWTRNTIDPDEILKTNVQTAAREMALHGRCKFDNFCKEMRQIENSFRILPHILTYSEYMLDMEVNSESYFN